MHIDCDSCVARGAGCADCVVALFLGAPGGQGCPSDSFRADLDQAEADALAVLAGHGLVPPVRMSEVRPDPRSRRWPAGGASVQGPRVAG